jgi:hypothetical protein
MSNYIDDEKNKQLYSMILENDFLNFEKALKKNENKYEDTHFVEEIMKNFDINVDEKKKFLNCVIQNILLENISIFDLQNYLFQMVLCINSLSCHSGEYNLIYFIEYYIGIHNEHRLIFIDLLIQYFDDLVKYNNDLFMLYCLIYAEKNTAINFIIHIINKHRIHNYDNIIETYCFSRFRIIQCDSLSTTEKKTLINIEFEKKADICLLFWKLYAMEKIEYRCPTFKSINYKILMYLSEMINENMHPLIIKIMDEYILKKNKIRVKFLNDMKNKSHYLKNRWIYFAEIGVNFKTKNENGRTIFDCHPEIFDENPDFSKKMNMIPPWSIQRLLWLGKYTKKTMKSLNRDIIRLILDKCRDWHYYSPDRIKPKYREQMCVCLY